MSAKFTQDDFDKMRNNQRNYKWGFFYYNPNDTRLIVPKRFGIGWTLNFANPYAYVFLFGIITTAFIASNINSILKLF